MSGPALRINTSAAGGCAAVVQGGTDDSSPLQLWDSTMCQYGVQRKCDAEIAALSGKAQSADKESSLKHDRAVAAAAA
eukprot:12414887-Karenia_brevis.AAC.1